IEAELLQVLEAAGVEDARVLVAAKLVRPAAQEERLLELGEQHRPPDRRRQRRPQRPMITPGVHALHRRGRIASPPVGLQPLLWACHPELLHNPLVLPHDCFHSTTPRPRALMPIVGIRSMLERFPTFETAERL